MKHGNFRTGPRTIKPQAPNVLNPGATIIQQLQLHTGEGLQRLIMLLVSKLDPAGAGILIDEADAKRFADILESGRRHLGVIGAGDTGFVLKLVDDKEGQRIADQAAIKPRAP